MDVVVDMLAYNSRSDGVCLLRGANGLLIAKLTSLTGKACFVVTSISVLESSGLGGDNVVGMLLRQDLAVLHRLDGSVIVVLVDLLVYRCLDVFVPGRSDILVRDSRGLRGRESANDL